MNLAVGTSLLSVGAFGIVTAARYGLAGQIIVPIAILYVIGGIFGGIIGAKISTGMKKSVLRKAFSIIIIIVGIYVAIESYHAIL